MIRHSSSFIISLVLHTALFLLLFFSLKTIIHETKKEEVVCVKLCNVVYEEKIEQKPVAEIVPHTKSEITPQKIEKKVTPKAKEAPKRVETIKAVPVVQETPKEIVREQTTAKEVQTTEQTPTPSLEKSKEHITNRLEQDYLEEHLQKIVKLLQENLYYPRSARERGVEGEVIVKFMITEKGDIQGVEVLSSKSEMLSNAAIKTIENLSGSFPKAKENLHLQLPISYSLK
ncbi:MAG: energy transducer TonB [Sulfurimonas sp.]|jgi:protein TonB